MHLVTNVHEVIIQPETASCRYYLKLLGITAASQQIHKPKHMVLHPFICGLLCFCSLSLKYSKTAYFTKNTWLKKPRLFEFACFLLQKEEQNGGRVGNVSECLLKS